MPGRWCSAAEVAADVSRAGGGVAPPAPRSIAGACLAWSARPAPLTLTEGEGQGEGRGEAPAEAEAPPPDLRGITRMLRMVQPDDTDEESASCGGGGIVISRLERPRCSPGAAPSGADGHDGAAVTSNLNPNVAEFVPRSSPPAREGGGGRSAREREELAVRLREDISGGRDKCSAIARLMRLYAEPAPRLLTPDYFERPPAPEPEPEPEPEPSAGTERTSPETRASQPAANAHPAEVRASVDKVRRWLGSGAGSPPAPRASPRLLLAPVTFRSRTPASPARTPPPPPPAARGPAARAYSPPANATAALQQEYAARAAAAAAARAAAAPQPAAEDTLWTRLEAQLRQRDAEKRARAAPHS